MSATYSAYHLHSTYSLLDGQAQLEEYFKRAEELGLPSISISDHGNLHHVIDAYETAKDFNVKYTAGEELYLARKTRHHRDDEERAGRATDELDQRGPLHLSAVARNQAGFRSLMGLSSDTFMDGFFVKPRCDYELLSRHSEGLTIFSGCLNGPICQPLLRDDVAGALAAAQQLQDIVGKDNFFIEVMRHGLAEEEQVFPQLVNIASRIGAKIIPTIDSHYVHREDAKNHDISLCQPGGTIVLKSNTPSKLGVARGVKGAGMVQVEEVPIEDIVVGDRVVSWSREPRRGAMSKTGRKVTATSSRYYEGPLIRVSTESGVTSSYTPDHICVARFDSDSVKPYVVYLMRKGSQYRIGITKFRRSKGIKGLFGPAQRAKDLGADAVWILKACDTTEEALLEEAWLGYKFNIPTLLYNPYVSVSRNSRHQIPVSEFWERVGDNTAQATECLRALGRDIRYPIWTSDIDYFRMRHPQFVRACNLLDGMMVCVPSEMPKPYSGLTYDGTGVWQPITISSYPYEGRVYSIEVETTHTYVADGIVTHNCIGTGSKVADENRFKFHNDEFYLKSYGEMATLFPEEWLRNTLDLNEMIEELDFSLREFHFPVFDYDGDHYQYLRDLTYQGVQRRYGGLTRELEERVEYELGVISRMGFVDYMLIVWDIIEWCHSNGILANARGSASGAVVAYCLGITNVDPLRYNLLFERFLIEGRVTMPDIDIDVPEDRREDVINYIKSRYGYDRVSNICNFSTIGAKAAIRDCARVLGHEYSVGDKLSNMVPAAVQGFSRNLKQAIAESPDLAEAYKKDPVAKEVLDAAMGIEGQVRQTGVHAAGILVTPGPLSDYCPIMQKPDKEGNQGPIVTQWNGTQVESQGLLKIDVLGLRNFTILDRTVKYIAETQGISIHPEEIPDGDFETFHTLQQGHTSSVFQLSSSGITQLVQDVRPDRLEDIAAINALYRPGPLGSGMDKTFVARKHGYAAVEYPHPALESALQDSLGLMVYQENILQIAELLAGYSAAERDALRKLVGKKKKDEIPKARGEFVRRCMEHSGISQALAEHTFDEIEYFGSYGFNRSHAFAYAYLAYQTAYFKTHYPTQYMAAVLSSIGDVDSLGAYVLECQRMGIQVLPPSINTSDREFTIVGESAIQYGLRSINGIGEAALDRLLSGRRDYQNIYDWLRRVDTNILNKALIEHLINSGALDELISEQPTRLLRREEKMDLLNAEYKELGSYLTENPLDGVWTFLQEGVSHTVEDLVNCPPRARVTLAGLVISSEHRMSKNGNPMTFVRLQDPTGSVEVASFGESALLLKDQPVGSILFITGRVDKEQLEDDSYRVKLYFYDLEVPQLPEHAMGAPIFLSFPSTPANDIIEKIVAIVDSNPGDRYVILSYRDGEHTLTFKINKPTSALVEERLKLVALGQAVR